jgi:hypothetical protein
MSSNLLLNLTREGLNDVSLASCLEARKSDLESCTTLDLSHNNFGNIGVQALEKILSANTSIQHLFLQFNYISDSGAEILATLLASNKTIQTLDVGSNSISSLGALTLLRAAKSSSSLQRLVLFNILLPRNPSSQLFAACCDAAANASLRSIHLTNSFSFLEREFLFSDLSASQITAVLLGEPDSNLQWVAAYPKTIRINGMRKGDVEDFRSLVDALISPAGAQVKKVELDLTGNVSAVCSYFFFLSFSVSNFDNYNDTTIYREPHHRCRRSSCHRCASERQGSRDFLARAQRPH